MSRLPPRLAPARSLAGKPLLHLEGRRGLRSRSGRRGARRAGPLPGRLYGATGPGTGSRRVEETVVVCGVRLQGGVW